MEILRVHYLNNMLFTTPLLKLGNEYHHSNIAYKILEFPLRKPIGENVFFNHYSSSSLKFFVQHSEKKNTIRKR